MEMKIVEIDPPRIIKVEYVNGDFLGYGEFMLDNIGNKTQVTFFWDSKLNSKRVKLLTKLLPVKYIHWLIVNLVLRNLARHVMK